MKKRAIMLPLLITSLLIGKSTKSEMASAYLYSITVRNKTGDRVSCTLNYVSNMRNQIPKKEEFVLEEDESRDIQIGVATATPNTNDWVCNLEWKQDDNIFETAKYKYISSFTIKEDGLCDIDFIEWLVEKEKKKYATGLILPVEGLLEQDSIGENQLKLEARSIEDLKKLKAGLEAKQEKLKEFEANLKKVEQELKDREKPL